MIDTLIELLKTVLIGIVQGITEWLPVSSTGHMILIDELVSLRVSDEFRSFFLVVIQLGSILAVLTLYFHKLNPFSGKKSPEERTATWSLWGKVLVAAIPAAIAGLLLDDWLDAHLYNYVTVAATLVLYGILFLVVEKWNKGRKMRVTTLDALDCKTALGIGAFQMLSLVPGTSRSGSTILGASVLGVERSVAAEFSFFLAIPIMLGASGLKFLKYVLKVGLTMSGTELLVLAVGLVTAFAVSVIAIKFLMSFVRRHSFAPFGVYRIVLGALVLLYFALRA